MRLLLLIQINLNRLFFDHLRMLCYLLVIKAYTRENNANIPYFFISYINTNPFHFYGRKGIDLRWF